MQNLLVIHKPKGITPLEVIHKIKELKPQLAGKKITYAGRLDPLAHGVLLLLIEEGIKQKTQYLSLPKTYEFEMVFGLQTDTYDLLGYLDELKIKPVPINVNLIVNTFVSKHTGKQLQKYPPYSSRTVKGKPLFWWAKENRLDEITIPTHELEIFNFETISMGKIRLKTLKQDVENAIASVNGDFRQDIILKRWQEIFAQENDNKLKTAKFRITCSSGTYVRELVNQLGKAVGCGAVALDIFRTHTGEYTLKEAIAIPHDNLPVNF